MKPASYLFVIHRVGGLAMKLNEFIKKRILLINFHNKSFIARLFSPTKKHIYT